MSKEVTILKEEEERKEIVKQYRALLRKIPGNLTKEDKQQLRKAFDVAVDAHKNMRRKSGEPYILHPIAVARIAAEEIGLGATAIICALLHDVVEDSEWTIDGIKDRFGEKVASIISGLTKIDGVIVGKDSMQAENFRKLLLTMADDVRVILIKLCDRLHNMRTLSSMSKKNQLKIGSETLYLYAPLAHRLGLNAIKTELEDLSLKHTQPDKYHAIADGLQSKKAQRKKLIANFIEPVKEKLNKIGGIEFVITGRPKSIYSIYKKMVKQGVNINEVYDLLAVRIILNNPNVNKAQERILCWKVYAIITDMFVPNPKRYRDWLSAPKPNGYEAVHSTVMGPDGRWVEVQIRTQRMDEIAERGYAAHWKYKNEGDGLKNDSSDGFDRWLANIKEILSNPDAHEMGILDDLTVNLDNPEIFVFTPTGDLKRLTNGSMVLDFAYDIHTKIGDKCIGAKINGKLKPINHKLENGDQIEVITSEKQKPREEWKKIVQTGKAKSRIKSALKEERKKIAEEGQAIVNRKFRSEKIKPDNEKLTKLFKYFKCHTSQDFYHDVAVGKIPKEQLKLKTILDPNTIVKARSVNKPGSKKQSIERLRDKKEIVLGEDDHFDYSFAKCCNPIPGDSIFGFITINAGIKIHRTNCPNATGLMSNYGYRIIKAEWRWKPYEGQKEFLAGIRVTGFDDVGIISTITDTISKQLQVNMKSITVESNEGGTFEGKILVYIYDTKHLEELINQLEATNEHMKVIRIEAKE